MAQLAQQVEFLLSGVKNSAGQALAAGRVYTYAAGTLNPKTVWTDAGKAAAATNPVILDGAGTALIYADGLYKFIIQDSNGGAIATRDNLVYGVDGSMVYVDQANQAGKFLSDLTDGGKDVLLKPGMIQGAKGIDVASAATLTLGNDGNFFNVTGTTGITAIATKSIGTMVLLQFSGSLLLTHHASNLILPSGRNFQTRAGDVLAFVEYGAGTWRCIGHNLRNRGSLVRRDTAQTITNDTETVVVFSAALYDTDAIWNASVNQERLTIPTGVRRVRVSAGLQWASAVTGGYVEAAILKNGAVFDGVVKSKFTRGATMLECQNLSSGVLEVTTGDYFTLAVRHTLGSNLDLSVASFKPWLCLDIVE